jgi:hypothetical protein
MHRSIAVGLVLAAILASARSGGADPTCVVRVPGEQYYPWEFRIVRCLNRLGRPDEAREAARASIPALEALRGVKPRGILPKPRVFQKWIDQLLAFAGGGPGPD